jgi:hypothetical protein
LLVVSVGVAVATEYPYYIVFTVAVGYPAAILLGILGVENGIVVVPPTSPRGQQSYVNSKFVGFCYDKVHVVPIVISLAILAVGGSGVAAFERKVPVGIGNVYSVNFGKRDGLYYIVAFSGAVFKIVKSFVAVETME